MVALPNIGGALCSTPQSLADAQSPTTRCRAVTLPRRETRWNLQECPKLVNRSQPLVGRSSPYCEDMWMTYCYLTSFFSCLSCDCEDIARQSCAMVPRWRFLATFLRPLLPAANILIPLERQLIALQLCHWQFFYIMKLCSRLFVLYCQNCLKDDKFRYVIPILRKLGVA